MISIGIKLSPNNRRHLMSNHGKKIAQEKMMEINAGKASPAPPIGPALGGLVSNVGAVCKEMNDKTRHMSGDVVRVLVRAFTDKSYELEVKKSPTAWLIKKELGIDKGSESAGRSNFTSISASAVRKIAEEKMDEMTASSVDAAEKTIKGILRSMGISVEISGGQDE